MEMALAHPRWLDMTMEVDSEVEVASEVLAIKVDMVGEAMGALILTKEDMEVEEATEAQVVVIEDLEEATVEEWVEEATEDLGDSPEETEVAMVWGLEVVFEEIINWFQSSLFIFPVVNTKICMLHFFSKRFVCCHSG